MSTIEHLDFEPQALSPTFVAAQHPVMSWWRRLTITDAHRVVSGDLLMVVRTGELVRVRRVAGERVDVDRGVGSTSGVPIRADDELLILPPVPVAA